MTKPVDNSTDLCVAQKAQIDELCDSFELAWKAGRQPRLEDYLVQLPDVARIETLRSLLMVELELRRAAGETCDPAGYQTRFPGDGDTIRQTFALLAGLQQSDTDDDHVHLQRLGRYEIRSLLGSGGFAHVFLAYDTRLDRLVAVKVPKRHLFCDDLSVNRFIQEARTAAGLKHPGLVVVHDVQLQEGWPYIVQEYINGPNVAEWVCRTEASHAKIASIIGEVTETVGFLHGRRLIHRDLKPGNILVDSEGHPRVVDFGLAVHEWEQSDRAGELAGTWHYMSPEQLRGETHLLDGRSDLWSLGIVLYELLAGQRPFSGSTPHDLYRQILAGPRPFHETARQVPHELERICLRCLQRRQTDRYASAAEMGEDLQFWLAEPDEQAPSWQSSTAQVRVVPKGLRSFDKHDIDFFLSLLPGPRDRNGLPDSIRFWKTQVETFDRNDTFSVGLIYGPSGCGKSSLVKAGLLPLLDSRVVPVYLEAGEVGTEARLAKRLEQRIPRLPQERTLAELLCRVREDGIGAGRKLLIIIDQFEQWLHANRGDSYDSQLVNALRHCDGEKAQCIVLVRDDFWVAVTEFMRDLEITLVEGRNSHMVTLFDLDHAHEVLAAFGRAYGKLADDPIHDSTAQQSFLDQAIRDLAEENKVTCVRLALFSEMMKDKPWIPKSLQEVGGTQGVGVRFLEETFGVRTAPPRNRRHQRAVCAVLKSLLPAIGSEIKSRIRSEQELLRASGYASRPDDFSDLVRLLDNDFRLVTPIDPEIHSDDEAPRRLRQQKYYQLTHDFLVPSLREWLVFQQRQTYRGRLALRAAELSAAWNAKPENRHLPSWWEYLSIVSLAARMPGNQSQRKMMRQATWFYGVRTAVATAVLLVFALLADAIKSNIVADLERVREQSVAEELVHSLQIADITQMQELLTRIAGSPEATRTLLEERVATVSDGSSQKLNLSLALLLTDPQQVDYLYKHLLQADSVQFPVIRDSLAPHAAKLIDRLWEVASESNGQRSLNAACALASYDSKNSRWIEIRDRVAADFVAVNPAFLADWKDSLQPVSTLLVQPLSAIYGDPQYEALQRSLATVILADYARNDMETLTDLLCHADLNQYAVLFPVLQENPSQAIDQLTAVLTETADDFLVADDGRNTRTQRQANAALTLLQMGQHDLVWPLLQHRSNPTLRARIIHEASRLGVDINLLASRLEDETDDSIRRALILALGEYESISANRQDVVAEELLDLFENDPDPGIHAAAKWVLRRWQKTPEILEVTRRLAAAEHDEVSRWFVTQQGYTMVKFPGPMEFRMGSPDTEDGRYPIEVMHTRQIDRNFAIASTEVTVRQFQEFRREVPGLQHSYMPQWAPEDDCPQTSVTWFEAAAYCRWLSEKEGLPDEEMCYPEIRDIGEGMTLPANYLSRTGYRLPTEAEWEFACRAGSVTCRHYGETEELLGNYGWYIGSARDRTWPVGSLKPNDAGLFDMHGNVWEWCQERYDPYPVDAAGTSTRDVEDMAPVNSAAGRILRGGAFATLARDTRSACRSSPRSDDRTTDKGFRIVRTYH